MAQECITVWPISVTPTPISYLTGPVMPLLICTLPHAPFSSPLPKHFSIPNAFMDTKDYEFSKSASLVTLTLDRNSRWKSYLCVLCKNYSDDAEFGVYTLFKNLVRLR